MYGYIGEAIGFLKVLILIFFYEMHIGLIIFVLKINSKIQYD